MPLRERCEGEEIVAGFTEHAGDFRVGTTCGVFYSTLGLVFRAVRRTQPRFALLVSRITGTAMILIGCLLAVERILVLL